MLKDFICARQFYLVATISVAKESCLIHTGTLFNVKILPLLTILFQMEIKAYCDAKEVTLHGNNIPNPILNFDEATFPGKRNCW